MTGLLSQVQRELEETIRPLDKAIKEALDLGQVGSTEQIKIHYPRAREDSAH